MKITKVIVINSEQNTICTQCIGLIRSRTLSSSRSAAQAPPMKGRRSWDHLGDTPAWSGSCWACMAANWDCCHVEVALPIQGTPLEKGSYAKAMLYHVMMGKCVSAHWGSHVQCSELPRKSLLAKQLQVGGWTMKYWSVVDECHPISGWK